MIKSQKLRKKSAEPVITVTIITIIAFSTLLVLFAGSANTLTVHAQETDTINATKLVNAPKDAVWEIISNVDRNPEYWPVSIIKNIYQSNNTVEREVTVPAPPFMDDKAYQIITIHPEQAKVIENQTQGSVMGVKTISLLQAGNDTNKTEINIVWDLDLSKIPDFGKVIAKDRISNTADEALTKIANTFNS